MGMEPFGNVYRHSRVVKMYIFDIIVSHNKHALGVLA